MNQLESTVARRQAGQQNLITASCEGGGNDEKEKGEGRRQRLWRRRGRRRRLGEGEGEEGEEVWVTLHGIWRSTVRKQMSGFTVGRMNLEAIQRPWLGV
ncbi:hypothetical protein Drorol1_Dr00012331 [Drosera rotundifolia]